MKIKQPVGGFAKGYNAITEINGKFSNMLMNFGILELDAGETYTCDLPLEKVAILLSGEIEAAWAGETAKVSRDNCFDADIWTLNVDKDTPYTLTGVAGRSELAIISTENSLNFPPFIYTKDNTTQEVRGVMSISESTLYPVLRRLQKDGCLEAYDQAYAGRNRRYYRITAQGRQTLEQYRQEWREYEARIHSVLFKGVES